MRFSFWHFVGNRRNGEIASWLGGGAVVVVGGLWGVFTYFFPHEERKPMAPSTSAVSQPAPQVSAGRDVIAGRDIVINVTRVPYLEDKYITNGILRQGWSNLKPSGELLNSQNEPLAIYPTGLLTSLTRSILSP
jgi:hypothetical protein